MSSFEITLQVPASTKEEALSKARSAAVLISKLNPRELSRMAEVVSKDPIKTAMAKKYLGC